MLFLILKYSIWLVKSIFVNKFFHNYLIIHWFGSQSCGECVCVCVCVVWVNEYIRNKINVEINKMGFILVFKLILNEILYFRI